MTSINILALAADMIFAARIRGAAQVAGTTVTLAASAATLIELVKGAPAEEGVTVILDLDTRGLNIDRTITDIRHARADARVIAYVSHVNAEAIRQAREAGATRVLARSAFTQQMTEILRTGGAGDGLSRPEPDGEET